MRRVSVGHEQSIFSACTLARLAVWCFFGERRDLRDERLHVVLHRRECLLRVARQAADGERGARSAGPPSPASRAR